MTTPIRTPDEGLTARQEGHVKGIDQRYAVKRWRIWLHRALDLLPPAWREPVAERCLRRSGSPGPAAEHAVQYRLSAARVCRRERKAAEATVAKGADNFYDRQYRQTLNATMGAFAMTATQALLASGTPPQGWPWQSQRRSVAAMVEQIAAAPPILVLGSGVAAVAIFLPRLKRNLERIAVSRWLNGHGPMPEAYRSMVSGEPLRCFDRGIAARERSAAGDTLEVLDAVIRSRRLAILALHPHDPDAMGLHITLFGTAVIGPERLERDYGLEAGALGPYYEAARALDRTLLFCVGGTEETFTQCSQNLFVKRCAGPAHRPPQQQAWDPRQPLEMLLENQFELIQATVSASGLPGASPRNGDRGKAAFIGRRGGKVYVLIPYHPGNAVHGHAAKIWTNPYGTLVISDDHRSLTRVTLSGPAKVVSHSWIERCFPAIAEAVSRQQGRSGSQRPPPEYWFRQEVAELVQQREFLAANQLDPVRSTCSISAGGEARHGKKPHYFAADGLPAYDREHQHHREKHGRPRDPGGAQRRDWLLTVGNALNQRKAHLAGRIEPAGQPDPSASADAEGASPRQASSAANQSSAAS